MHPPAHASVLLAFPTPTAVHDDSASEWDDADELDVELVPVEEARIEMTDRAAEVRSPFRESCRGRWAHEDAQQLRSIAKREGNPDAALRIAVESGGCHGYQYKMELAETRAPDD